MATQETTCGSCDTDGPSNGAGVLDGKGRGHSAIPSCTQFDTGLCPCARFLVEADYEIRTLMNAILGFAELLEDDRPDLECSEAADAISRNGRRLLDLIENFLDFSQRASQSDGAQRLAGPVP